ncbi:MAG: group III truncated hemoglobin [Bacteroidota bacterium]|nr:group III truncated hemoglobin [Bacteroidota bacterium]
MKKDIATRDDIKLLVDEFYGKVQRDELIGPVFSHVDWPHHLPTMYNFWSSMLLGDQSYRGNPFQKHLPLPLSPAHFDRWLKYFRETVNEHFAGDKATEILMRAEGIAGIFQSRLGLTK